MSNDTDKINLQDHDLLIAVYTLQQEFNRRLDEYIKIDNEKHTRTTSEIQSLNIAQTRVDGEITSMKGMWNTLDERIDSIDTLNKWLSVAALIGAIAAVTIGLIK